MKKFSMRQISVLLISISLLILPMAPSVFADSGARTYDYHLGDAFLTALDPSFGPDVAMAPNGDTVTVEGTGTFSIHAKSVSGGGTFTHKDKNGNVLGTGTWSALQLLSFHSYGNGTPQGLPPEFEGGQLIMRVHLSPDADGPGFDAILQVHCELGDHIPAGVHEGIRLNVPGVANFNQEVSGATVYVRTS